MSLLSLFHPATDTRQAANDAPDCCVSALALQHSCGHPSHHCTEPGCCQLGRWLDSAEARQYSQYPAFQQLRSGHQELHEVASEIMVLQELGRDSDAASLHAGEFSKLQRRVQQRLLALKAMS